MTSALPYYFPASASQSSPQFCCGDTWQLWTHVLVSQPGSYIIKNICILNIRHGSNELDSSSATERSIPVMLSAAKHLAADGDRPFASLRVTRCDCSNCQGRFVQIEPCLTSETPVYHNIDKTVLPCSLCLSITPASSKCTQI